METGSKGCLDTFNCFLVLASSEAKKVVKCDISFTVSCAARVLIEIR
jgi:hypothetical protein